MVKKLKNVDIEFIEQDLYPAGMDEDEAREMDSVSKHTSKIIISRNGKVIWEVEPLLYQKEFVCGDELEEGDDFATLNIYKPSKMYSKQSTNEVKVRIPKVLGILATFL